MPLWAFIAAALTPAPMEPPPGPPVTGAVPSTIAIPGTDPEDAVVDGKSDYHQRMTVPVTIDGQGPFRFMIDTGAQATVVTRGLTEELNLISTGSATVVGMGSRKSVQVFELDGLEFAERVLNNITAPMLEKHNIGADGILGLDSLQDLRVMIDFRNQTIAVDDAADLGGDRGYEIVVRARHKLGRLIITKAIIDGVKTSVIIDTGAQSSFGNMRLRKRLRARDPEPVTSTDVNGAKISGNRHIAKSLQIQGLQLTNMPITFADSPVFAALNLEKRPAVILGMRDLRLFNRIAIDFSTRRVLFDLPKGQKRRRGVDTKFEATRL